MVHMESPGRLALPWHAGSDWADVVGSVGLYPIAVSEQDSDISEVMYSTHPAQYQLPQQSTDLLPPVCMATDLIRVLESLDSVVGLGLADDSGDGTATRCFCEVLKGGLHP